MSPLTGWKFGWEHFYKDAAPLALPVRLHHCTQMEAQKEIADNMMTRLQQFLDGEREYEGAIEVEEYVVPVILHPDGVITDEDGNSSGPDVM